ncbi:hypothetical protein LCGC14_2756470 [marine sediment metagenome]|uniref:Uncharacterized protein n=1 Tax=marine sediment metagenome TaxID=412755 RepID=A0A0F8ZM45_9ZZZZ
MNRVPKKIFDELGKVKLPKDRLYFAIVLARETLGQKDSYEHDKEIEVSLKEMEKFLDSVPPNKHTQKIKRKVWEMFP